ncbi:MULTISPECIES: molybdenum cofactor biosynthesis protein MoaE [unclassified Acidocella]|uniref:molybdenum cofactor biosynthesis protein MoaE n=1 Tax=unclassified Acidocella TaxID=2648610 RepID=UPI00028C2D27|nr:MULTISPECIES: molybdenum cofactor biosynthesis protein MoaE [unclassified Acidocella]EKM98707.1 molybdopterin converting factor large subunit MoeE [Acidocella sp. MX-AZ02]WBO58843.1 molybdenum cofactor biosynthesis protein MoaE [Acidocella sp. MX-AZ03]
MFLVSVQEAEFDSGALLAQLGGDGVGGIASFIGLVRQTASGDLAALRLEHYPGMTEAALTRLLEDARARWDLAGAIVIHRIGRLAVGAPIVFVATASAHRAAALESTAFLIDCLKTGAPFWKAEERLGGETAWVEARAADEAAAASWHNRAKNLPQGKGRL